MDEKQIQFIWDNYASKGKGFKDFSEFKNLMSDGLSRKKFFDLSNSDLGFKDYNEFESIIGVKKKGPSLPEYGSSLVQYGIGSTPSQPSQVTRPSVYTDKGAEFYEKEQNKKQRESKQLSDKLNKAQSVYFESQGIDNALKMFENTQSGLRDADVSLATDYSGNYSAARTNSANADLVKYNQQKELLTQKRNTLSSVSQGAVSYITPYIDAEISSAVSGGKLNNFVRNVDGDIVPDEYKVDEFAKSFAKSHGLSDEGYAKKLVYNKLKSRISYEVDKPAIEKEFNNIFKSKYGVSPDQAVKNEYIQLFKDGKQIDYELSNQVKSLGDEFKSELKNEADLITNDYKPQIDALNNQLQSQYDSFKLNAESLNQAYKSKQISTDQYNSAISEINTNINTLNQKYKNDFDKLANDMLVKQNELASKYDKKYRRQIDELSTAAKTKLSDAAAKYGKNFSISEDLKNKYESAWQEASKKYVSKKQQINYSLDKATELIGAPFVKNILMGIGGGLKSISMAYDFDSGYVLGDYIENSFKSSSPELKSFSDLFDLTKIQTSAGRMLGGMAPIIAGSAAVGVATQNAPVAVRMATTGLANYVIETAQIGGAIKDEVFAKTGSMAAAETAAKKATDANIVLLPLYAFEGLPFIDEATLGIKNMFARAGVKAGIEYVTELPQEYFQNVFEDIAKSNKDINLSTVMEGSTMDRFENTALNIAPTTLLLGGAPTAISASVKEVSKLQGKSYAAKIDLSKMSDTTQKQFLYDLSLRKSDSFTKAVASSLFNSGVISEEQLKKFDSIIESGSKIREEAKKLGLNKAQSKVYAALKFNYIEAKSEFDSATDESSKLFAKNKLTNSMKALNEYMNGSKPEAAVVYLANNEQYVYSFDTINALINEKGEFLKQLINGDVKIGLLSEENNPNAIKLSENIKNALQQKIEENAVQEQETSEVPVQPETAVSEEVAIGEPQAEPQVVTEGIQEEVSPSGVSVSNKASIAGLRSKVKDSLKVSVIDSAEKSVKALQSVLPGFDIVVHETPESYNSSMGELGANQNTRGNFSYVQNEDGSISGRIDINLSNANSRTVAHEVAHGIMLKAFGESPDLFKTFRDKISKELSASTNEELIKFSNQYIDNKTGELLPVNYEEYLAELTAILAQQQDSVSPSVLQKIASYINSIVSRITGGKIKPFEDIKNTKDIIDFFNNISGAIREGEAISESDIEAIKSGLSVNIGDPSIINRNQIGEKIEFPSEALPLSFVTESDKIDINSLIDEIIEKKQKVWFWMADQLGRGEYYDEVINGNHYLDAGPSFALDPKNRENGILWASGVNRKALQDKINESDYIFFISGSPEKAKLFNKRVLDLVAERINANSNFSEFKKAINNFATETNDLKIIKDAINSVKSFNELSNSPKRKPFLIAIDNVSKNKKMPTGSLKELLNSFNVFVDYNELRDGFYKYNNFGQNDIMLVGKPTALGGKAPHSTYENAIIGEVIGVPDVRIDSWNIMPDSIKEKYKDVIGGREEKTKPMQTKVIAAEIGQVRGIEAGEFKNKSQAIVAGVEYTIPSAKEQSALDEVRTKKSYFDNLVSKLKDSKYSRKDIVNIIKDGKFAILTGENPMGEAIPDNVNKKLNSKAKRWLRDNGFDFEYVAGKYGQAENSFFVEGMSDEDALRFAKEFNQDSVVTGTGMIYQDSMMNERVKSQDEFDKDVSVPDADYASAIRLSDGSIFGFKVGLDFENKVQSPVNKSQISEDQTGKEIAKRNVSVAPVNATEKFTEFEEIPDEVGNQVVVDSILMSKRNADKVNVKAKNIVGKLMRALSDTQFSIAKFLNSQKNLVGDVARAAMRARKGYTGLSSLYIMRAKQSIFDKLSKSVNIKYKSDIDGKVYYISESELFDKFLDLNRIKNIDARIRDKFSILIQLSEKLKRNYKNMTEDQIKDLVRDINIAKEYLLSRNVLKIDGPKGDMQMQGYNDPDFQYDSDVNDLLNESYEPIPYKHTKITVVRDGKKYEVSKNMKFAEAGLSDIKNKYPDLYKKFEELSENYYDIFRDVLKEQYDAGVISDKTYNELYSYNYIPTRFIQHYIEDALSVDNPNASRKLSGSLRNLTGGSEADNITNYEAILNLSLHAAFRKIYENKAGQKLSDVIIESQKDTMPAVVSEMDKKMQDEAKRLTDMYIEYPSGYTRSGSPKFAPLPKGKDYIKYYVNGEEVRIVVPAEFAQQWYDNEFKNAPWQDWVIYQMQKISLINFVKGMRTKYNIRFGILQVLVDAPQAIISTKAYPDLFLGSFMLASDYAKTSKDIYKFVSEGKPTPLFLEAVRAGIFSDFLATEGDLIKTDPLVREDGDPIVKNQFKEIKRRLVSGFDNTLDSIAKFNEGVEYATRLAVYYRMKNNLVADYKKNNNGSEPTGQDLEDIQLLAAEQSRNVIDFSVSGGVTKQLNRIFPYLNSAVQAFASGVRGMRQNPYKAALMVSEIGVAAATVLAYTLGDLGDVDDEEKEKRKKAYMKRSQYERNNFFLVWTGSDDPEMQFYRHPKPAILKSFANVAEQTYMNMKHGIPYNNEDLYESFKDEVPPGGVMATLARNPFVDAWMKYGLNYDQFKNEPVFKGSKDLRAYMEGVNNKKVSQFYKDLGMASSKISEEGISPIRLQAAVRSYTGDPTKNTITSIFDAGGKGLYALYTGNTSELKETFPNNGIDDIFKISGFKGALFAKESDYNEGFVKELEEEEKDDYTREFFEQYQVNEIRDSFKNPKEGLDAISNHLLKRVKDGALTIQEASKIFKAQPKLYTLKDSPKWYNEIVYSNNDRKAKILAYRASEMTDAEFSNVINDLLVKDLVDKKVILEALKIKETKYKKK